MTTTAFVLPGGSSLAAVQVGMAEALTDAGIRPDLIVGSSAGSLNGAWLAAYPDRQGVAELRQLWLSVRRRDIFPLSPVSVMGGVTGRRDYLVSSAALKRWLNSRVAYRRVEQARTPLHIMATDLVTGEAVRLSSGDLITALLASTAIPGIYPPVSLGGRVLVDGGIADDTPIGEAVSLGADRVYVLPTVGVEDGHRPRGAAGVALRAMAHILGHASDSEIEANADRCELYVVPAPPTSTISPFSFAHSRRLMDTAHSTTAAWLPTAKPSQRNGPGSAVVPSLRDYSVLDGFNAP
jgi:NTE family protein